MRFSSTSPKQTTEWKETLSDYIGGLIWLILQICAVDMDFFGTAPPRSQDIPLFDHVRPTVFDLVHREEMCRMTRHLSPFLFPVLLFAIQLIFLRAILLKSGPSCSDFARRVSCSTRKCSTWNTTVPRPF